VTGSCLRAALLALLASTLLVCGSIASTARVRYQELGPYRRLWDDLSIAISAHLDRVRPNRMLVEDDDAAQATVLVYRRLLIEKIEQGNVRPWQFWRRVSSKPFIREGLTAIVHEADDAGRARLLALGFGVLGGIAPFLILWLALLVLLPVVWWTAFEFEVSGHGIAVGIFLMLVGCSPFVVDTLALSRAPIGFYLVAVLLLVPFAGYAILGHGVSRLGLFVRTLAAGALFGVCAACRSGSLLLAGGFLLALLLAVRRVYGADRRRRAVLGRFAIATAIFFAPYLAVRMPQHHDVWMGVWEGLGDFDRSKGHIWSDQVAAQVTSDAGSPVFRSVRSEAILRQLVLQHVREDPAWYMDILAKRVWATLTLRKLWPTIRSDHDYIERSTSPNEGGMDKYWGYTTTVDFLGFGESVWEMPIALLIAPTLALLALAALRRGDRARPAFVLACLATAAAPLPILISTASGAETEAFACVYFLGAGFLIEACAARRAGATS
jgi:hypothetical protein